jgi:predicted enzyme related to lactoylglutathione lyase
MSDDANYFEIATPNPAKSADFYRGLFGWSIGESADGYQMINTYRGGLRDTSGDGEGTWATFLVQVDDVRAVVAKAAELGATVAIPFTDDHPAVEYAHLCDLDGNRFGVWRPKAVAGAGEPG